MTGFQINYDLSALRNMAARFERAGKKSPDVLKRAVKHTGDKATSAMRTALVGQTGLKRKTLVKAVKGTTGGGGYVIRSRGGNIRLKFFSPRETSKGVTAAPWNSRRLYPATFIKAGWWPKRTKVIAGGQVLRRAGAGKYPIHGVKSGLFIAEEMVKGASADAFYSTIDSDLAPRVEHELNRVLGSL